MKKYIERCIAVGLSLVLFAALLVESITPTFAVESTQPKAYDWTFYVDCTSTVNDKTTTYENKEVKKRTESGMVWDMVGCAIKSFDDLLDFVSGKELTYQRSEKSTYKYKIRKDKPVIIVIGGQAKDKIQGKWAVLKQTVSKRLVFTNSSVNPVSSAAVDDNTLVIDNTSNEGVTIRCRSSHATVTSNHSENPDPYEQHVLTFESGIEVQKGAKLTFSHLAYNRNYTATLTCVFNDNLTVDAGGYLKMEGNKFYNSNSDDKAKLDFEQSTILEFEGDKKLAIQESGTAEIAGAKINGGSTDGQPVIENRGTLTVKRFSVPSSNADAPTTVVTGNTEAPAIECYDGSTITIEGENEITTKGKQAVHLQGGATVTTKDYKVTVSKTAPATGKNYVDNKGNIVLESGGKKYDLNNVESDPGTEIPPNSIEVAPGNENETTVTVDLSGLTASPGTISPSFASNTKSYNVSVGNSTTSVTFAPKANEGCKVTVTAGSKTVTANSDGTYTIDGLAVGKNEVKITVSYRDIPLEAVYTVTITREDAPVMLHSLTVNPGTLNPAFASETTEYNMNVGYGTSSVTITPAASEDCTITVNGQNLVDGKATVPLNVGKNTITVTVARQGKSKTYTITVNRAASSGGSSSGGVNHHHDVTTPDNMENGSVTVSPQSAVSGTKVTVTVIPDEGYTLDSLTITGVSGNTIPFTDNGDGTYTFTMPGSDVTVTPVFTEIPPEKDEDIVCKPYRDIDISETSWYHEFVHYMIEKGLMTGISKDEFAPNMNLSRAMVTQILYSRAGYPDTPITQKFSDVQSGQWFAKAVSWAAANNIAAGYTDGTFKPNQDVTREQLAVMLYGGSGKTPVTGNELNSFPDCSDISFWAKDAVLWAVQNGIMEGNTNHALEPQGTATRAHAAVMFMRYIEK